MIINIFEARNRLSQLIKQAQAGETVVIGNRGLPVAQLVAIDPQNHNPSVGTGFLQWLEDNPLPAHLRRTQKEMDDSIEAERSSWD
jgi:prevent-host-death family protein